MNKGAGGAWIVVASHVHREALAEQQLTRQGYLLYAPVIRKQIRHARKVSEERRPMFPGYLFVHLGADMRWRPILSTVGVRSVICSGDKPSTVPASFIDDLKAREENGAIARAPEARRIGQTVTIAQGAFDGLAGRIVELPEKDRIVVLMDILSRPVRVTVRETMLSVV
jgi:transcriptional antiterminator RfaH